MSTQNFRNIPRFHGRRALFAFAGLLAISISALRLRADEPYARSRDYDLQHSRIALRFNLEQKKVIGDDIHTLTVLREATSKIVFDSAGLTIQNVTVNKSPAKFETKDGKLSVALPAAARAGEKLNIEIRYEGKPTKGLYFILPDKDYPDRPKQIWTQGESEDTRYYLPTYDYPNDRLTTDTILTVPASWITVSNGKLISVADAGGGLKTWTWKESLPSSTYLITVVAGEFDEVKESWRGMPVTYYAPKGRGDRLSINYGRTPAMIELFSQKLGVDYPWEKYAQSMVDDFVAGGMENSSATTNTSSSLRHPNSSPAKMTLSLMSLVTSGSATWSLAKTGATSGSMKDSRPFWKPSGPKRISGKIRPITSAGRAQRSGSSRPISIVSRSFAMTSMIPASSTAMLMAKAAGSFTCFAISLVKTLSTVVSNTTWKQIAAKTSSPPISPNPLRKPLTSTSISSSASGSTEPALQNST